MSFYFLERFPRIIVDHNGLKTEVWPVWYDPSDLNVEDVARTIIEDTIEPDDEAGDMGVQFVAYFGVFQDAVDILSVLNNENTKPSSDDYQDDLEETGITRTKTYTDLDGYDDELEPEDGVEEVDVFFRNQWRG